MRHGNYLSYVYGELLIMIFIGGVLALLLVAIWLVYRRLIVSDSLACMKPDELPVVERKILSILQQHNGSLAQNEIFKELHGNVEVMAETVKDMEAKGLLERRWKSEQGAYMISIHQ